MSDTESVDYLQQGFDPWSLTVPRLRSILVTYNVQYPASAKKPQLIELFNEQVAPQAGRILARRARAKRSSSGIEDAGFTSRQSTNDLDLKDHELMPPPSARRSTRSKSPRKSTRGASVKAESEEPEAMLSPRKQRQSRSSSRQLPTYSDTDTGADSEVAAKPARRARTKTPVVKEEEDDAVFTSDNPFQSGGSSPPQPPVKTPSNRRKTTGTEVVKATSQSERRRRTDVPAQDHRTFSKSFEMPISKLNGPKGRSKTPEPTGLEPGEEFTPEEQLELSQLEETDNSSAVARRTKPARKATSLATPVWVLIMTLLTAYGAWYRQEKLAVGYCGVGRDAHSLIPSHINIPEWAEKYDLPDWLRYNEIQVPESAKALVEPQCEPCPQHAICYDDFTVKCEPGYILQPHPLSFGGLVPLPPTCEPDGEKARRTKLVADKMVEELREQRAHYECGEPDTEGKVPETPFIEEEVLKETVSSKRSVRMSNEEFDDLFFAALGEVKEREEVVVETVQ